MPAIERNGFLLHYVDRGAGPAIILQHALTADGRSWDTIGVTEPLVQAGFRVIQPDALGHGRSGPASAERVDLTSRVADLVALADALGVEQFHYAGYSMGGWIGIGLLRDAPHRLLSMAIAGWDPVDGARRFTKLTDVHERRREFVERISTLITQVPGRAQADKERMRGYADTYARLFTDLPSIATLFEQDIPLTLAVGRDDPYREPAGAAADALGVDLIEIPGDHVTAFLDPLYAQSLLSWFSQFRD